MQQEGRKSSVQHGILFSDLSNKHNVIKKSLFQHVHQDFRISKFHLFFCRQRQITSILLALSDFSALHELVIKWNQYNVPSTSLGEAAAVHSRLSVSAETCFHVLTQCCYQFCTLEDVETLAPSTGCSQVPNSSLSPLQRSCATDKERNEKDSSKASEKRFPSWAVPWSMHCFPAHPQQLCRTQRLNQLHLQPLASRWGRASPNTSTEEPE